MVDGENIAHVVIRKKETAKTFPKVFNDGSDPQTYIEVMYSLISFSLGMGVSFISVVVDVNHACKIITAFRTQCRTLVLVKNSLFIILSDSQTILLSSLKASFSELHIVSYNSWQHSGRILSQASFP